MSRINDLLKLAYNFEKKIASSDEDSFEEEKKLLRKQLIEDRLWKKNEAELTCLYKICNEIDNIIYDLSDGKKFEDDPQRDSYYGMTYVIDSSFEKLAEARLILTEALDKIKKTNNF